MVHRFPHRLRKRYIEDKPKDFRFVGAVPDIRIVPEAETLQDLADLRELIRTGRPVPERYYRPSMRRRGDDLLFDRGIMHLHLKSRNDDAIAYLIQYEDHVLFICLDTHRHLNAHPPGAGLRDDLIKRAEIDLLRELALNPMGAARDDEEDG